LSLNIVSIVIVVISPEHPRFINIVANASPLVLFLIIVTSDVIDIAIPIVVDVVESSTISAPLGQCWLSNNTLAYQYVIVKPLFFQIAFIKPHLSDEVETSLSNRSLRFRNHFQSL
jgi:hypothetical protein